MVRSPQAPVPPGGPVIEARRTGLRLGFRDILRHIDLTVNPGQVVAVLGANGAGKTSLLRVLATLSRPTAGRVRILGHDARSTPSLRRHIGYLGHQPFLYPQLTGLENLRFWGRVYGVRDLDRRAEELLERSGLGYAAHEPVRSYSRGMQQRLALARAVLHEPAALLLDEPYTGLDRSGTERLDALIGGWRDRGGAVVLASHDLAHSLALSDLVVVLRRGSVALLGGTAGLTVADLTAEAAR